MTLVPQTQNADVLALAATLEHTLLKADATADAVRRLCEEAIKHGFGGVCVNPARIGLCRHALRGHAVNVVTVVGFPLGATLLAALAEETRLCVDEGADEIDMVIPIGQAIDGDLVAVKEAVACVVEAARGRVVKAILETGYFGGEALGRIATAAVQGGARYLKTSTGFGPRGASVDDVQLLVRVGGRGTLVKASGGIRSYETARAMLAAGASRLGTSSGVAIMAEAAQAGAARD